MTAQNKKIHFIESSGRDITDEYFSFTACCRHGDSKHEWEGTHDKELVTCKICLKKLKEKGF